ncbi:MAG: histidine--tRNA ligase [Bacteroidota bacterium]
MIQAIRGTKDILPDDSAALQYLEEKLRQVSARFGYREMRTPIFEKTEVFSRSIGENTDIVNKEMYTFEDRGGDSITLRPENTASIVRAVAQNSLLHDVSVLRLWYYGPFFRYERPQKGRMRQFHQYGAECLGSPNPESDFEIITLADRVIKELGIKDYRLLINTLGNEASRSAYRNSLADYLKENIDKLSEESRRRVETNPLRVLDSKDKEDKSVIADAPVITDSLDEESSEHYNKVIALLDSAGVRYTQEAKLVRGLDYYSHTVFEFQHDALGAQDAFGGGGRYNKLFEQLGAKPAPSIGFAMGVERLLIILEAEKLLPEMEFPADVYIVTAKPEYFDLAARASAILREKGIKVVYDLQRRSMKAQFKEANKLNVKTSVIIGDHEYANNSVSVKNMESGEQKVIALSELKDNIID